MSIERFNGAFVAMKKYYILLILLVMSACTSPTPSANLTGSLEEATKNAYPAPVVTVVSTPTFDSKMGQLRGQMLLNDKPMTTGILYLAELIKDNNGQEIVASFSRESKIRSDLDQNGNFVFSNVPSGRYGLVYDLVSNAYLLTYPDRDESFIVTIIENEDQDLGILNYPKLPDSSQ